jgi:DNA-directed RNA polymerase specialized sigma24 family protein
MPMSLDHSISHCIAALKAGDLSEAGKLWERYQRRLVELASQWLVHQPKTVRDEDDVAQSVFLCICRGAAAGRLDDVRNRDELWWLLLAITRQKTIDLIRRQSSLKSGGQRVKSVSAITVDDQGPRRQLSFEELVSDVPTPEMLAILADEHRYLLGLLRDDDLRRIATSRLEGYSVDEISSDLIISKRSVERKLRLIRDAWTKELLHAG